MSLPDESGSDRAQRPSAEDEAKKDNEEEEEKKNVLVSLRARGGRKKGFVGCDSLRPISLCYCGKRKLFAPEED